MSATKRKSIEMTTRSPRGKKKGAHKRVTGKISPRKESRGPKTPTSQLPIMAPRQFLSFCEKSVSAVFNDSFIELYETTRFILDEEWPPVFQTLYAKIAVELMTVAVPEILIAILRMAERTRQFQLDEPYHPEGTGSRKGVDPRVPKNESMLRATQALQHALALFPEAGESTNHRAEKRATTQDRSACG